MIIDVANFYLMTPMDNYEHLRMRIKTIASEITKEHNLDKIEHDEWLYVEMRKVTCISP